MSQVRIILVDDEPLARKLLSNLLKEDPEVTVVAKCSDGFEAVRAIRELHPDIVCLDIQMPEKDGFEVIEEIGATNMPLVIFITAHDDYALRAFDVYALDYLLKPFDPRRFHQTIARAKALLAGPQQQDLQQRIAELLEERRNPSRFLRRIAVRSEDRISLLKINEIDWVESEGNYLRIHSGKASYLLRQTMHAFEKQLDPNVFIRIHRCTIVNLDRVTQFQQMFHGDYLVHLMDGTELKMSRGYRHKLPKIAEKS